MDRRVKGRARRAARARVEAAVRRAVDDQTREALNAVFDRSPAAVDITYYGNTLAAGANARAIRGYEFASERWSTPSPADAVYGRVCCEDQRQRVITTNLEQSCHQTAWRSTAGAAGGRRATAYRGVDPDQVYRDRLQGNPAFQYRDAVQAAAAGVRRRL